MSNGRIAATMEQLLADHAQLMGFIMAYTQRQRAAGPDTCDFVLGNPHDMPLEGFGEALARWAEPRNPHWYAYKTNEENATATVAQTLRRMHGIAFEPDDVFMTSGAFAGLSICLRAVGDPGDEVLFVSPPWFFYDLLIRSAGLVSRRVPSTPPTFDLPVERIEEAISGRTRAIIVNSPNNPTGRIYPGEQLQALAGVLRRAEERFGRPVYVISDEAYSRIVYEGAAFPTPTAFHSSSFLVYTYGKTLLAPGSRLGYVAFPPDMPERGLVRQAMFLSQIATAYSFPHALLMHAIEDLEPLSIDVKALERKRDRMSEILTEAGYEHLVPEGTFYMMARAPIEDDGTFTDVLAGNNVLVLPGSVVELPGWFRISLTATEEMVERSADGFTRARREVGG